MSTSGATVVELVTQVDRESAEVVDLLNHFTEIATSEDDFVEVLIVGIKRSDGSIVMGSSGQVGLTEQVGALERFKMAVLTKGGG